ncbi:MAG: VWA domain-containing protein [Bacteroidota bacterium]
MKLRFFLPILAGLFLLPACYHSSISPNASEDADYRERYNEILENPFIKVADEPTSTFSIDADGGAYTNIKNLIESGQLPPENAVRTEELINFFPLNYDLPSGNEPMALNGEVSSCPWQQGHKLIRIGLQAKSLPRAQLPATNWVLLIDVSGSMSDQSKLPLLKEVLTDFVDELRDQDRLSIVTYSGRVRRVLASTSGSDPDKMKKAINKLRAAGSTAGGKAIEMAYEEAVDHFIENGNNQVVLMTDGDFNVGITDQDELIKLVEEKRKSGVFFTTIGVGRGNLNEGMMEQLANHGNGRFEYIGNKDDGTKILIRDFAKFYPVAKDVKIQVSFRSEAVDEYRLIGYENRVLNNQDFDNDSTDAGEIGMGQNITALYEIIPAAGGNSSSQPTADLDFRYKNPNENTSLSMNLTILDANKSFDEASESHRFVTAVAGWGLYLFDSSFKGEVSPDMVRAIALDARQFDPYQYRDEFIELVTLAEELE